MGHNLAGLTQTAFPQTIHCHPPDTARLLASPLASDVSPFPLPPQNPRHAPSPRPIKLLDTLIELARRTQPPGIESHQITAINFGSPSRVFFLPFLRRNLNPLKTHTREVFSVPRPTSPYGDEDHGPDTDKPSLGLIRTPSLSPITSASAPYNVRSGRHGTDG